MSIIGVRGILTVIVDQWKGFVAHEGKYKMLGNKGV